MKQGERFEVFTRPVVTLKGLVLVVRREGSWSFPAIQVSSGDEPGDRMRKGLLDMLGLEVQPHQILDAVNVSDDEVNMIELFFHAGASDRELEEPEDLEAEWVDPMKLDEYLEDEEAEKLERRELSKFVQKLDSVPGRK